MADHAALDALIASLGLTYSADFVPFSRSRNANPKAKIADLSVNWLITLSKGNAKITTDYQQGIGHLPEPLKRAVNRSHYRVSIDDDAAIRNACEGGRYPFSDRTPSVASSGRPLPRPELRDVLYSLVSDSDAIDSPSFEDWASNFGYNTDSRKAEATYRACLDIGLKLRAMLGDDSLKQLREAYQDY